MKSNLQIAFAFALALNLILGSTAHADFILPLEPKTSLSEPKVAETLYYAMASSGWLNNTEVTVEDKSIPPYGASYQESIRSGQDFIACQQIEVRQQLAYACQFSSESIMDGPTARTLSSLLYQLSISSGGDFVKVQGSTLEVQDSEYWLNCQFNGNPKRPDTSRCDVIHKSNQVDHSAVQSSQSFSSFVAYDSPGTLSCRTLREGRVCCVVAPDGHYTQCKREF